MGRESHLLLPLQLGIVPDFGEPIFERHGGRRRGRHHGRHALFTISVLCPTNFFLGA